VGGHKPRLPRKGGVRVRDRLLAIGFCAFLIVVGVFRIQHGTTYVLNWYREPVYSYGLIIAGVIVLPFALISSRWADKVFAWAARRSRGGISR
jgi:hypothetical protein